MENLIMNEEDKEMYSNYLMLQNNQSKKEKIIVALLTLGIFVIGGIFLAFTSHMILEWIIATLTVTSAVSEVYLMETYRIKKNKRKFKLKNPNFNDNLSIVEIEKALQKYNESVKTKEMLLEDTSFIKDTLEEKVEVVNRFISMNPDEKIAFLEKEKDFWQQEKLKNIENTKEIQKRL